MTRRMLAISILCFSLLSVAATATAAPAMASKLPPKCLRVDAAGDLPTCTNDGSGWQVSYPNSGGLGDNSGGGIPSGFIVLFVIVVIAGIGTTVWRVSMARNIARRAGMNPNQATAVTLLGNDGLDAAYLAANLRGGQATTPPAATPSRTAAERLSELQQLKDQGLVTADEYETRRKAIVDSV